MEEVVAAVLYAFFAVAGADQAGEGGEPNSEEDGELDHLCFRICVDTGSGGKGSLTEMEY